MCLEVLEHDELPAHLALLSPAATVILVLLQVLAVSISLLLLHISHIHIIYYISYHYISHI